MFFTANISAQKKQELKLQWTVAAELPVTGNGQTALGFAGMVAGVYSNKLIIAGENQAGKTTLCKIIFNIYRAYS